MSDSEGAAVLALAARKGFVHSPLNTDPGVGVPNGLVALLKDGTFKTLLVLENAHNPPVTVNIPCDFCLKKITTILNYP